MPQSRETKEKNIIVSPRNIAVIFVTVPVKQKMLTHEKRALLVLCRASFSDQWFDWAFAEIFAWELHGRS